MLPPVQLDITKPETLLPAFQDAKVVVSLVGLLAGTSDEFDKVQWKGAENVARAAKAINAKLVHISAIGANANSNIPYMRTKGLAENAVFHFCPDATVIRPSLVFGPDDDFFNVVPLHIQLLFIAELSFQKFSRLSRFLPFLPVFAGGKSRFQPVCVHDIARAVEVITRHDGKSKDPYGGKIIEAGGPEGEIYTDMLYPYGSQDIK